MKNYLLIHNRRLKRDTTTGKQIILEKFGIMVAVKFTFACSYSLVFFNYLVIDKDCYRENGF